MQCMGHSNMVKFTYLVLSPGLNSPNSLHASVPEAIFDDASMFLALHCCIVP
jgi:hypothetical protein